MNDSATSELNVFPIPVVRWDDFVAKFKKLQKRAAKLDCEPITFTIVRQGLVSHVMEMADGSTKKVNIECKFVLVSGTAPRLADWRLVARVEEVTSGVILVHTVPGVDQPVDARFRTLGAHVCEHCKTARIRRDVYVVRHDDGREMQVGRQCLRDFAGHANPETIAQRATMLFNAADIAGDSEWFGGLRMDHVPVSDALSLTAAYIRGYGWSPRSANTGAATADLVANHYSWSAEARAAARESLKKIGGVTEDDRARAAQAVAWVKDELSHKANRSDYEQNLVLLVVHDVCKVRHLGVVCSAVATALRVKSRQEEKRAMYADLAASSHAVGTVGERLRDVPVRVLTVRVSEGRFGAVTLVKMVNKDGCVFTWFASRDIDVEPGMETVITGTVKKHGTYQGVAETMLSRVDGLSKCRAV